jgi:hypothetical protein
MHDGSGIEDLAAARDGEAEHVDRRRSARFLCEPLELALSESRATDQIRG